MKHALPLSLDLGSFAPSVQVDEAPVSILNESSTLIGQLAFCVGVVDQIANIAYVCNDCESVEAQKLASVVLNQIGPLDKMLKRLVNDAELQGAKS